MKELIKVCVRRPVTMVMSMAAILIGGFLSFFSLPLEHLPDISLPRVVVETVYSGMGAEEIRALVTIAMEDALSTVKGLEGIHSVSRDGTSIVTLSFRWGTNPQAAASAVREAVDAVYPSLPGGVRKPVVIPGDSMEDPLAIVAVKSPAGDNSFARNMAEYEIRSRFRQLDGTGVIVLVGGTTEEILIDTETERLASMGYSGSDFAGIIASEIVDIPAGNARQADLELTVVSAGRPKNKEELAGLILPSNAGPLKLKDFAETRLETAPRKSLFIYDGEEQTALEIYRRRGADPVKLSGDIKKVLKEINGSLSRDIELKLVYDGSAQIVQNAIDLFISVLLAAFAVSLILFAFMRRLHYSLLAVLALPISSAASLIALLLAGRSLNSMSLAGLAMGIGLVSDTSVVMLDLFKRKNNLQSSRLDSDTIEEIAYSISGSGFSGTITTVIVFVPIIFLPGTLGALFGDLSIALISSVVMGWLYSQFFLPSFYFHFLSGKKKKETGNSAVPKTRLVSGWDSFNSFKIERFYRFFLSIVLKKPRALFTAAVIFVFFGFLILLFRPFGFMSPESIKEIEVTMMFKPGTVTETAGTMGIKLSAVLKEMPEIENIFARMGAEDEDIGRRSDSDYRKEKLVFRCFLKKNSDADSVLKNIRDSLPEYKNDNVEISVSYPLNKVEKLLELSSSLTLVFKGKSRDEAIDLSRAAEKEIKSRVGASLDAIYFRPSGTRPELRLIPDREAAAYTGISAAAMAKAVYAATEGIISGTLEADGKNLSIRTKGSFSGNTGSEFDRLPLPFVSGSEGKPNITYLGSITKIEQREAEAVIARQDRSDAVYMDIFPSSKKDGEIKKALKEIPGLNRADVSVLSRYQFSLFMTIVLVIVLLYLAMAAQFESFILPFILMMSIPFSLAGSGPAIFLSGSWVDSGAILGFVVLFGLVVNNAIIMYEVSNEKFKIGLSIENAVFEGAVERFRPVLITTLTTAAALLPLIFANGRSQRSMSSAMLGGIIASTFLTLFVMPIAFKKFIVPGGRYNVK
jgi:multidrug efflux pump subunit AcrB